MKCLLFLLCWLCFVCAEIKTVEQFGRESQFELVAKFCFDAKGGVMKLKAEGMSPGAKLYLFHDFEDERGFPFIAESGHSCNFKIERATNTYTADDLAGEGWKTTIVSAFRPRWWYVVIANCDEKQTDNYQQYVGVSKLTIDMQNTESSYPHISDDEAGVYQTYIVYLVFLLALLLATIFMYGKQQKDESGQKIYQLTGLFGTVIAVEFLSVIFKIAHYHALINDGVGHPDYIKGTTFLDVFPDTIFVGLLVLLSKGWQINEQNFARLPQGGVRTVFEYLFFYLCCSMALFAWTLEEKPLYKKEFLFTSTPGLLIVALHMLTMLWFLSNLAATYRLARVMLAKTFYFVFGAFGVSYLAIVPIAVAIAAALPDYNRMKDVVITHTVMDMLVYLMFFIFLVKSDFLKRELQEGMAIKGVGDGSSFDDGMINMGQPVDTASFAAVGDYDDDDQDIEK